MVRCRWSGNAPSPARGCQGATKRLLGDGCRESGISRAWFTGKTDDHGVPGSLEARPGCRWNGQNVPPWFGAGGAGRLQDQRVIDRRYGLLMRSGSTPDTASFAGGMQRGRASGSPCQDVRVLPHTSCSPLFAADFCLFAALIPRVLRYERWCNPRNGPRAFAGFEDVRKHIERPFPYRQVEISASAGQLI